MNVTDDDGDILNTARYELVREADLNIAPGERMAVPLQVYPLKEGRAELLVEEIDVGIPTDRSVERTPLEVVLTAGAAVDSIAGDALHPSYILGARREETGVQIPALERGGGARVGRWCGPPCEREGAVVEDP